MKPSVSYFFHILAATASTQLVVLPFRSLNPTVDQKPLMDPVGPGGLGPAMPPSSDSKQLPAQGGVLISDVMGRDRSINIFAGFTRDIESISHRLDKSSKNSTVLAPLNSHVEKLPRKPWEDSEDYKTLGANAYEGVEGQDRAQNNLRRFVEAHVVPASPWPEKEKVRTLLGDKELWWESKNGAKVIQPDNIEVDGVVGQVGNGELWKIRGVRNYT